MAEGLVTRHDDGALCTLTLNRPDKLNSINNAMFVALDRHVRAIASAGAEIGCVVLRGAGRCFSAGHDLGDIATGEAQDFGFESRVIERLANLPQAVITAIHGHCYTGALELALAGDIILVSESARIADTHAKWALTPVWGMSQRLPRRVGFAKAREMMFTAKSYTGAEAAAMGLANACFADDRFADEVAAFANSILANSAFSIAGYKALMAETDAMPMTMALAHEVHNTKGVGPDMHERIARFSSRKA
ncbi:enoyl-CoA hydratase/isomerase family protein [Novosphingobium cyanobacteriorum]|uniref:Enoyl-CoA hydratase/isomerase family protein n=1 Tax=Novosphingobium cyanobacteriorum TaxID=3024215 RepID=A0ABT6CE35_9SPHN|nr:enoyl-CoA hydratase/isomerase family protein [Novosphingobium cyanobacteriorum]MDF8332188.1 enoyl-CoA hydratase/isomerase family protein [Novosphingobium cyanobacteriorum]